MPAIYYKITKVAKLQIVVTANIVNVAIFKFSFGEFPLVSGKA